MNSPEDHPVDFSYYARALWRRKSLILVCMIALISTTSIAVYFIPDQFQSGVMLLIQDRQPLAMELEQILGGWRQPTSGFRKDEERLSRLIGRVRSRPFLERVVKILQISNDPRIRSEALSRLKDHPGLTEEELAVRLVVDALQSRIQFGAAGPGLYKIMVTDHSAANAYLLAKWISELFVDITIEKELDQIRLARDFGAEQLRVYEEQLEKSERALEQYRGAVIEQDLSGSIVNSENLAMAENLQRRLADEGATASARVPPLARAAEQAGMPPNELRLIESPEALSLSRRISSARDRSLEEKLAAPVSDLRGWQPTGEVDVLRRDLHREIQTLTRQIYPDADGRSFDAIVAYSFAAMVADIQQDAAIRLRQSIGQFKRQAQMRPVDELELSSLEDEVKKNRELLKSFRAQMLASDVSQAIEATNLGMRIEIIDPAQIPLSPTKPDRIKMIIAACLIGPMVGIGFAFLAELLDPTLRSIVEIKRVAPEPILGTIPLIASLEPRTKGFRRYWIPATVTGFVLLAAVFFLARTTILQDWKLAGEPVQMVDPGRWDSQ